MNEQHNFGHWQYPGFFDPVDWFGFIYRIIDLTNDREYIGKKQFWSTNRKPPLKGKKRVRIVRKESDWKQYTSSSTHVNEAISEKGKDRFIFLIEALYKSKAALHYAEVETQLNEDVLRSRLPNGDRKYYNKMIANMKFITPDELPEETKMRIRSSLKLFWQNNTHNHYFNKMTDSEKLEWNIKYRIADNNAIKRNKTEDELREWIIQTYVGESNPMFGVTGPSHPRWGVKLSDDQKANQSEKMKGRFLGEKNPRYGKSPFENFTPEQLEERKRILSERFTGEGNPMYGKPCYHKMSEEQKLEWKQKISESTKGKPKSEETKKRMSKPRGPCKTVECPHCGKIGGGGNMQRYHFDNCKKRPK